MYIVYDTNEHFNALCSKYLVLELDTLEFPDGRLAKAHAVIDSEHIQMQDVAELEEIKDLHSNLIKNYHNRNWNYCEQAMDYLRGKFKGELDTFYDVLSERIEILKDADLSEDWSGNIQATQTDQSE